MYDHIPFEIQVEIIKKLPIKSLIRFRSVSKPWKSFIDSSEFIAVYKVHHSQPHRLLVSYRDLDDSEVKYVSIDDDGDTFPQRKCSLNVPLFIKLIKKPEIVGSSHGLLCLYGYYREENLRHPDRELRVVVLWNPSIQTSVAIKVPNVLDSPYESVVGFGVCPNTNDPKLVKINCISVWNKWKSMIHMQVEVFTLSSRAWRIPSRNLPRKSIMFNCFHIVVDGYIYWLAYDRTLVDDYKAYHLIISFDLTSDEFREIYLPEHLAQPSLRIWSISKLRNSLVVLELDAIRMKQVYDIWMMDHGVPNTFKKLFTIEAPNLAFNPVLGFRENGEALLQTSNTEESAAVEVYEPSSKHIKDLGIYGQIDSFFVSSYNVEMLILLGQPDSSILL